MTFAKSPAYRQLELDSSNRMMEWGGRWVLGRYEEATAAMEEAGLQRLQMGQICAEMSEYGQAAEDWLSAAECLLQASDPRSAAEAVEGVRDLFRRGLLPAGSASLTKALEERAEELRRLREKIQSLGAALQQRGFQLTVARPEHLDFLRQQVRELPGFAPVHFAIAQQARGLGRNDLAAHHLMWAARFDHDKGDYLAQYGFQLIQEGQREVAREVAEDFLEHHPHSSAVRLLLAAILVRDGGDHSAPYETALEVLRPLIADPTVKPDHRAIALDLAVRLCRQLGREEQARDLLGQLEDLEQRTDSPGLKATLAGRRAALVARTNGSAAPADLDSFAKGNTSPWRMEPEVEKDLLTATP